MHKLFDDINQVIDVGKYLTFSNQKKGYIHSWIRIKFISYYWLYSNYSKKL
jgi:hypothetical protein